MTSFLINEICFNRIRFLYNITYKKRIQSNKKIKLPIFAEMVYNTICKMIIKCVTPLKRQILVPKFPLVQFYFTETLVFKKFVMQTLFNI